MAGFKWFKEHESDIFSSNQRQIIEILKLSFLYWLKKPYWSDFTVISPIIYSRFEEVEWKTNHSKEACKPTKAIPKRITNIPPINTTISTKAQREISRAALKKFRLTLIRTSLQQWSKVLVLHSSTKNQQRAVSRLNSKI